MSTKTSNNNDHNQQPIKSIKRLKIAIIGGGIIGSSTAFCLKSSSTNQDMIESISLISKDFSPNTTGDGSAGLWLPSALPSSYIQSQELLKIGKETFDWLMKIGQSEEANDYGIGFITGYHLKNMMEDNEGSKYDLDRSDWLFKHILLDYKEMNENQCKFFGAKFGIQYTSLYAECKKLIPMLIKGFLSNDSNKNDFTPKTEIIRKEITDLKDLLNDFDIIINCSGLGSISLVPEDKQLYPIRGQVIRVKAPWIKHVITAPGNYIIPNSNEIILGGTKDDFDWDPKVRQFDKDKIWRGCLKLAPSLQKAEILEDWVGFRPGRSPDGPRIQSEEVNHKLIVHNYGHGGSGVTLFWGSALKVRQIIHDWIHQSINE